MSEKREQEYILQLLHIEIPNRLVQNRTIGLSEFPHTDRAGDVVRRRFLIVGAQVALVDSVDAARRVLAR